MRLPRPCRVSSPSYFEDVWQTAKPIGTGGVDAIRPPHPTTDDSESILDRLDYV